MLALPPIMSAAFAPPMHLPTLQPRVSAPPRHLNPDGQITHLDHRSPWLAVLRLQARCRSVQLLSTHTCSSCLSPC